MPKYKNMWFYGGPGAHDLAERKKVSVGGDARVLTIAEAKKELRDVAMPSRFHPRSTTYIVVAGKQDEPPVEIPPEPPEPHA